MALTANMEKSLLLAANDTSPAIDLDASHRIINRFTEVLQRNFKHDTRYLRPLMPPQSNIIFALDKACAHDMSVYMSAKLQEIGFNREEFRFVHKSGIEGDILQRLRLEFSKGVDARLIRKLLAATDRLERVLPYHAT